jgi:leader peptidase (prepilin peptidase)/N-methyltransferase
MAAWTAFDAVIHGFILFVGGSIGSFLNVCIYRMPLDQSIVFPASYCPSCQTPIRAFDNIPVLGYLLLRGRCRSCRTRISIRYPIVEAVTGLAALGSVLWLGLTVEAVSLFVLFALLLPSSLIDFEHQIIPNKITYPGIPLGIGLSIFRSDITWTESLTGVLIAAGVLFGIRLVGQIIFRKEAMGLGDVKLIALIGAFVGWKAAVMSVFFASVLGTLYSIPILIQEARSGQRGEHMIPFGPFLAGGGLVAAVLMRTWLWDFIPF